METTTINDSLDIEIHQFVKSGNHYIDKTTLAKYMPNTKTINVGALEFSIKDNPYYRDTNHFSGHYKYYSNKYFFNL